MSLREQLRDLLPQILPPNPSDAIKGTELIRLVRLRLKDDYSDATLRYHFSILCYDPGSPIAKVDQGQGYYLRLNKADALNGAGRGLFESRDGNMDLARARTARFSAIVERHSLHGSRFPFALSDRLGGDWELPDLVLSDWDFATDQEDPSRLDEALMRLKRHLGASVVTLSAAQLKLRTTLATHHADFFQTLSVSQWTNEGHMIIAEAVNDEVLVDALRTLGHQHGIGVTSFGIELSLLDEMPAPDDIRAMSDGEFDTLHSMLKIQRISASAHRAQLDWPQLSALRRKHDCIARLLDWLDECLEKGRPSVPKQEI
jgi:uncharacterized protein